MAKEAPKKRGRPRKSDAAVATASPAAAPKRRGRPPKSPATASSQSAVSPAPKKRSRLPKASSASVGVAAVNKVTKRRGRPPKTPSTSAGAAANKVSQKKVGTKSGSGASTATIIGGYAISCKAIKEEWPDQGDDLALDINNSNTPGVFEASFDFGILEGAMVLSKSETLLEEHIEKLEEEDSDSSDEDSPGRDNPKKVASKGLSANNLEFHLQWRGRSLSDDTEYSGPYYGSIKFTSKTFKKFSGTVDLAFVGGSVEIKGEKVTDEATGDASDWNDYGEPRYEESKSAYARYKNSNNWGYDRWGKWGLLD